VAEESGAPSEWHGSSRTCSKVADRGCWPKTRTTGMPYWRRPSLMQPDRASVACLRSSATTLPPGSLQPKPPPCRSSSCVVCLSAGWLCAVAESALGNRRRGFRHREGRRHTERNQGAPFRRKLSGRSPRHHCGRAADASTWREPRSSRCNRRAVGSPAHRSMRRPQ